MAGEVTTFLAFYRRLQMKRVALLMVLLMICTTAAMAQKTFTGSGQILIDLNSDFFKIEWGLSSGSAQFGFFGPSIANLTGASSSGSVTGTFNVGATRFNQTFTAIDTSSLFSKTLLPGGTITFLSFTGSNFIEITINAGDLAGNTRFLAMFDADFYWMIMIEEPKEEKPARPRLKLEAVGFSGQNVRMIITNTGNATAEGLAELKCGLSYKAYYWQSYSLTRFSMGDFGYVSIAPNETRSFDFMLPKHIPEIAINAFLEEREWKMFESAWWVYPDPPTDCFEFIITIGDAGSVSGFSPEIKLMD